MPLLPGVHEDSAGHRAMLDAYAESGPDAAERLHRAVEATGVRGLVLMVEAAGSPAEVADTIGDLGGRVLPVLPVLRPGR
ncbi:hypothetical protein Cs7R123_10480 [Catellatospora sp. TT07R-123]|uniref:hypothetical protein n=1 Tax=Catellatospora sp. TT07R-123 TaxID=2733863 RepID=UPI001B034CDE|nr:hypothetical protein [Catellatospora sp. TT07R-123]GHJ43706.1 hypothetical protein Cs7R123_10480 [Catellatospora sp. TT07R-123]